MFNIKVNKICFKSQITAPISGFLEFLESLIYLYFLHVCALTVLMHALNTMTDFCVSQDILLSCLNSAALPESCCALFFLRCVVFPGVIWSSSSRYGGRAAGAQHPSGHPEAQLPVEAGHEYFSGCLGAACWTRQGI